MAQKEEYRSSSKTAVSLNDSLEDAFQVDFHDTHDPGNPINWSSTRKWVIVIVLACVTMTANLATILCVPAVPQILEEFGTSNQVYLTMLVSMWELGEAAGPLLTAPMSEVVGRLPVYNLTNIIFILCSVGCAVSTNINTLIALRFFTGIGDASLTLNASIVGDMFPVHQRGLAITVMSFPALLGPVCGPIIGGYLAEVAGWRWTFWLSALLAAACEVGFVLVYRETYTPAILRARAKSLRKKGKNASSKFDFDATHPWYRTVLGNLIRPGQMLIQSPIVLILAVYVSVDYGLLFILLSTVADVFQTTYHFSTSDSGLCYLGLGSGMIIGVVLCALTLDKLVARHRKKSGRGGEPESRLLPMLGGALLLPAGLFLYGWTVQYRVAWIVPILGTATAGFAFFVTTIPLQSYLVDTCGNFAASAMAATLVMRCATAALMPIAAPVLYRHTGYGWGNSVLAFIALTFLPVPILLIKFGKRVRARTHITLRE